MKIVLIATTLIACVSPPAFTEEMNYNNNNNDVFKYYMSIQRASATKAFFKPTSGACPVTSSLFELSNTGFFITAPNITIGAGTRWTGQTLEDGQTVRMTISGHRRRFTLDFTMMDQRSKTYLRVYKKPIDLSFLKNTQQTSDEVREVAPGVKAESSAITLDVNKLDPQGLGVTQVSGRFEPDPQVESREMTGLLYTNDFGVRLILFHVNNDESMQPDLVNDNAVTTTFKRAVFSITMRVTKELYVDGHWQYVTADM